jgi:hypothetical protein
MDILVVVEDEEHPRVGLAGAVERLHGHTVQKRAVADHRDDIMVLPQQVFAFAYPSAAERDVLLCPTSK